MNQITKWSILVTALLTLMPSSSLAFKSELIPPGNEVGIEGQDGGDAPTSELGFPFSQ